MAVDLDDGVIDVDVHVLAGLTDQQRSLGAQPGQHPGGDRVELAHVAEGELTQERAQRRGCVPAGEDLSGAAVAQQGHVVDRVGAGDHPGHQGGHLRPGVGALVRGHAQVLVGQRV